MTTPIITVENLSKRYHLGQIGATTLRESVERWVQRAKGIGRRAESKGQRAESKGQRAESGGQRAKSEDLGSALPPSPLPPSSSPDDLWALKDVSFEVQPGEVLGIIGRNGAGKSTLLKILSRITEPTSGRAIIRGRVASLLEVGTGFHPELTGRENIFLNGAILGMRHAEIARKFDEIVAFAEVERFIDTPVKRYSSGMYVRLAFAVAAHLDPEILVVDEVLAVGDADFQKKCLGKMNEVTQEGRTVLFVSHNMAAIGQLCGRCVWLKAGLLERDGLTDATVGEYLADIKKRAGVSWEHRTDREGSGAVRIVSFRLVNSSGAAVSAISCGDPVTFEIGYRSSTRVEKPDVYLGIYDLSGVQLVNMNTRMMPPCSDEWKAVGKIACEVPELPLPPGQYAINVALAGRSTGGYDRIVSIAEMTVISGNYFGTGYCEAAGGKVFVRHMWRFGR